ncbi:MAG: sodium:proton antiporter [Deltaproteobacteria bacterium]|nr:MAG: sodium:proton antiporter [Deltaproteobacteria bacterium]
MYADLTLIAAFTLVYAIVAGRLEKGKLSGPIIFVAFGVLVGPAGLDLLGLVLDGESLKFLAELTLAVVLFADAAGSNLTVLKRILGLPARLLLVGLPLTILLGFGAAMVLFPQLSLLEAGILATMLAPTDAALGKAVVSNEAVPEEVREGLNFESGLNDGICVPILLVLLELAGGHGDESAGALALSFAAEELGVGLTVGLVLALGSAWAIRFARRRDWLSEQWSTVPVVALGILCFAAAQALGGSGFIAAFVGGLALGSFMKNEDRKENLLASAELSGDVLALVTWLCFGAAVVPIALNHVDPATLGYAALSLTIARMLPVFLSLTGMGLGSMTKLFVGWFGPRGLASVVFCVLVVDADLPGGTVLTGVAAWTIIGSVLAHGISASPLANAYAKRLAGE